MGPDVSVVIPTYNCAELLPRAIRSAFAQTVPPLEVVVVNDGSSDDTHEVLTALERELPGSFRWETRANGGEASARNRGLELARGRLIAFLDQDDEWLPEKLERQLPLFARDPAPVLTFTSYVAVSPEGERVVRQADWPDDPRAALERLMIGSCMPPSTVVAERSALLAAGGFDESLWLGSDWTMWLRIAATGRTAYLDEPLTRYLAAGQGMSADRTKISQAALGIFGRLFADEEIGPLVADRRRWCMARWHMIAGVDLAAAGQARRAVSHFARAAAIRPAAVRPGWLRALASGGR